MANNDGSVALQRVTLRNLHPSLENVLIVGIIIAKRRPKKFLDPKSPVELYRAVWNFTLRDSPQDYINVTFWGPSEVIFQVNDRFHTGDVVDIINPRINVRKMNDNGEQFCPMVTSPFSLSLGERSSIVRHGGPENYLPLLRHPTKPIAGFLPLRDVHNCGASIKGTNIDILAVVKSLGILRTITTKTNEHLQVRTVEVFDHTCPSLKVEIWEPDILMRSEKWKPRYTALFMTDVLVDWSSFQIQHVVKVSQRTVVTENPEGKEVELLLNYAENAPIETSEIVEQLIMALPDSKTIQDVMSVKQVQDKINICLEENRMAKKHFTALVFSFVTALDLDGLSQTITVKCGHCKMQIKGPNCENFECPTILDKEADKREFSFDMRILLTDHTGTLTNCRFSGQAVEQALGVTAREFSNMSDDQKCNMKWQYLLERCAVCIAVLFVDRQTPVISILQLRLADMMEVARRLPVY